MHILFLATTLVVAINAAPKEVNVGKVGTASVGAPVPPTTGGGGGGGGGGVVPPPPPPPSPEVNAGKGGSVNVAAGSNKNVNLGNVATLTIGRSAQEVNAGKGGSVNVAAGSNKNVNLGSAASLTIGRSDAFLDELKSLEAAIDAGSEEAALRAIGLSYILEENEKTQRNGDLEEVDVTENLANREEVREYIQRERGIVGTAIKVAKKVAKTFFKLFTGK